MSGSVIDWEQVWEELYDARSRTMQRDYQVDDWTERSEDYSEARRSNEYEFGRKVADLLLRRKILRQNGAVAEIGSGPGTFVIPIAPYAEQYTAIEPAEGMIARIHENAAEAGVTNYTIIPAIWQDVDTKKHSRSFDLVITSTVIWMFRDIMNQVRRMEEVSRGHCCIAAGFGSAGGEELMLWQSIMGDTPYPQYPEYPYIYNILYQNGRIPHVEIISSSSVRSIDRLMTMYRVFYSIYMEFTPEVEEKIRRHLDKTAMDLPEGRRIMRTYKTAVVWWDPSVRQPGMWEAE